MFFVLPENPKSREHEGHQGNTKFMEHEKTLK
jgi:hypothetical protein